jgi:hypothetical protein
MASTTGLLYRATALKADASENLDLRSFGFRPVRARVVNLTNQVQVEWNAGLAEGKNLKVAADGTLTVLASGGIVPLDADSNGNPGLRIPAGLADINDTDDEDLLVEVFGGSTAVFS